MSISKKDFGKLEDGRQVDVFTLTNTNGLKARIMTLGATLVSMEVPDKNGDFADVVLGFDTPAEYPEKSPYFGCITGRYANRVAKGRFTLDGLEYQLAVNNGPNHLHGGIVGFDMKIWHAAETETENGDAVKFEYTSPDGEENYPGTLDCTVTYSLNDNNELTISYKASTDKPTVLNLTNHTYWNLAGHASGNVLDQEMMINADTYTEVTEDSIPTGKLVPVEETEMDFRTPHAIGSRIAETPGDPGGYDHNYVINGTGLKLAAKAADPASGRTLELTTTEPGVQFYTANFLDGIKGKAGAIYNMRDAFCLETQHFPDSPNHPEFPSTVLRPGEEYTQITKHKFSTK